MQSTIFRLLLATSLLTAPVTILATTVFPREQQCPVCEETFIKTSIGSYSSFGEPRRDLSDSPFVRFGGVRLCPYCLFASLRSDFEDMTKEDLAILRDAVPAERVTLEKPERLALESCPENSWLRKEAFFGKLLARQYYTLRKKDEKRDMRLLLQLYYITKGGEDYQEIHSYYRKQCIETLSLLLEKGTYEGGEEAVLTYLVGELSRLDGADTEALTAFARAKSLASALPEPKTEDDSSFKWVSYWAFEQTCRIHYVTNAVATLAPLVNAPEADSKTTEDFKREIKRKVAIQVLAERNTPEAWAVLTDYVLKDPWRLDNLDSLTHLTVEKLKIDPRLWEWVEKRYKEALQQTEELGRDADLIWVRTKNRFRSLFGNPEWKVLGTEEDAAALASALDESAYRFTVAKHKVEPGETLESIARKYDTAVERLLELNPSIRNPDKISASMNIDYIRMPTGWSEERVMSNLDVPISKGHARATALFFDWIETLGPYSFEEFDWDVRRCLAALSQNTSLWNVPAKKRLSANKHQKILHACLEVTRGDKAAASKLLPLIDSKKEAEFEIALNCLELADTPLAKEAILRRLAKESGLWFDMYALSYLETVATADDLPRLKKIAIARCPKLGSRQRGDGFDRQNIEEAMMRITLRDILQRSLHP